MTITIEVLPLSDDKEISFSNLELFHTGCIPGTIQIKQNIVTNLYSLGCDCGLNIELSNNNTAENMIIRTAIDNHTRGVLPTDSFSSNIAGEVFIEPRLS